MFIHAFGIKDQFLSIIRTDFEGETRRGAERHRWHGAVPGIIEWNGSGKSSTEQRRESWSGIDQYGAGQVAWIIIRSEWSTVGK